VFTVIRLKNSEPQRLFWKLLGAIYCIAFLSLAVQITGLIGSKGILPLGVYLTRIAESVGPGRYWDFPTLFWLSSSDLALKLVCGAGALFAILLMAGVLQRAALIVCWALYLSLTTAGQDFLSFQWDILLLEAGFLAIFLGFSPVIVWMFRWLLFRLLLLSGAVKLLSHDPAWRTLTALHFHYQTQPLPTPAAWYMQQLPEWFHHASVVVMFGVELVVPFLIFGPRKVRLIAAGCIVFLQTLIAVTGNYTYFNLLTMALCIPLFSVSGAGPLVRGRSPGRPLWAAVKALAGPTRASAAAQGVRYVTLSIAAVLFLLSASQLLSQFFGVMPAPARAGLRLLSPLNLVNTYGLFAVMTTVRHEIILEGSNDGSTWLPYEFKYKPGDVRLAPRWVAPHQPRLDWQMWFAALGSYRNNPWLVNFVFRMLEGSPEVGALLGRNPFPNAPPRYIRALLYDYTFTDWQTRRATGAWWNREQVGVYLPAVSLQDFRRAAMREHADSSSRTARMLTHGGSEP
jgi:hypothetical protein